jgi:hypothetical protein
MGTVIMLAISVLVMVGTLAYLIGTMVRSISKEKRKRNLRKTWKYFGLSMAFCLLFLASWLAQGLSQWRTYVDEQRDHNQPVEVGEFIADFSQSTFENWQSEFLQLFSFVVLSAILIHEGSAESRDSDDRMEEALKRIEEKLGTKS